MSKIRPLSRVASVFTTPRAPEDFLWLVNPLSSARQLRGVVTAVVPETPDSATIHFRPGRGWQAHQAGQYARIGVEIDGVRHWRSYSLSAPSGADPAITVTANGKVSEALVRRTRPGHVLFLAPPQGDFVLPEHPRPLLMLTAGSGLTPVMSMVRTLVGRRRDADVVLVHSSRTLDDALFREELAALGDEHPGLRVVHWVTTERGRIDLTRTDDLDTVVPDWKGRAAYVLRSSRDARCSDRTVAVVERARPAQRRTVRRGAARRRRGQGGLVTFETSDREVEVDGSTPILEAGEDAGVVMPSGCRMGICQSCLIPCSPARSATCAPVRCTGTEGQLIQTCISAAAGPVHLEI